MVKEVSGLEHNIKKRTLDRIDNNILKELQRNGRISNLELSKRVGLSPTPCLERVKRLEQGGFISGYTALVNPDLVGASLLVFVEITLLKNSAKVFDDFKEAVLKRPEIQECYLVSGNFDYLLKARVHDMLAYRFLLSETLLNLPFIANTRTYVVMDDIKQSSHVPINLP